MCRVPLDAVDAKAPSSDAGGDGALALREAGHVAVRVGHELDLDVAWRRHELLDQQPVVSKRLLGLVRREGEALGDLARVAGHAHALAAAARARFEHDLCRFCVFLRPLVPTAASRASIAVVAMACFCGAIYGLAPPARHRHDVCVQNEDAALRTG